MDIGSIRLTCKSSYSERGPTKRHFDHTAYFINSVEKIHEGKNLQIIQSGISVEFHGSLIHQIKNLPRKL
jgi:hypothetical protein